MLAVLVCGFGLDLACYSTVVPYSSLTLLWSWLLPRSTKGNMLVYNFHNKRNYATTNKMQIHLCTTCVRFALLCCTSFKEEQLDK